MPKVIINLGTALKSCKSEIGMSPSALTECMNAQFPDNKQIVIKLKNGAEVQFLLHQENDKTVLTSLDILISSNVPGYIFLTDLPEILQKLAEQKVEFAAMQFANAFQVNGQISQVSYRAHFNHMVIYKDATDQLNATIIDSGMNPIGVSNPLPLVGYFFNKSIVSGEPLLHVQLEELLSKPESIDSLKTLCALPVADKVNIKYPIYTNKQPMVGDKRCGIYALNSMVSLINYITSSKEITAQDIQYTVTAAHQELNSPEMMKISFPPHQTLEHSEVFFSINPEEKQLWNANNLPSIEGLSTRINSIKSLMGELTNYINQREGTTDILTQQKKEMMVNLLETLGNLEQSFTPNSTLTDIQKCLLEAFEAVKYAKQNHKNLLSSNKINFFIISVTPGQGEFGALLEKLDVGLKTLQNELQEIIPARNEYISFINITSL